MVLPSTVETYFATDSIWVFDRVWVTHTELAPDFARLLEIHRQPAYDPAELFMDPADRRVKLRAGLALARKRVVMRYTMSVVRSIPAWCVAAMVCCHAETTTAPSCCARPQLLPGAAYPAREVRDRLLELSG